MDSDLKIVMTAQEAETAAKALRRDHLVTLVAHLLPVAAVQPSAMKHGVDLRTSLNATVETAVIMAEAALALIEVRTK